MTMDAANFTGSLSSIGGLSASGVATLCGFAKYATASQLAQRGVQAGAGVRVFTTGADKLAKVSSGLKVGGKVLGAAGGALSIGLGVYDLCSDPN